MKSKDVLGQFDIVMVRLDPTQGREQKGVRPCVILQTNAIGQKSGTMLVAPLTSQRLDRLYPHDVVVKVIETNGLSALSKIKLDQLRVIDDSRISKKVGTLQKTVWPLVYSALVMLFDLQGDFV